eukprot:FR737715.1.p5 GENE.FR737715.1~~FR737715.1.p5  ORF type:complete len:111 (+),score=31.72 FR737715.1:852-1184(+)
MMSLCRPTLANAATLPFPMVVPGSKRPNQAPGKGRLNKKRSKIPFPFEFQFQFFTRPFSPNQNQKNLAKFWGNPYKNPPRKKFPPPALPEKFPPGKNSPKRGSKKESPRG